MAEVKLTEARELEWEIQKSIVQRELGVMPRASGA